MIKTYKKVKTKRCSCIIINEKGEKRKCNGRWIKHANPKIDGYNCDNPKCPNYYICLDCGKIFGTHFDHTQIEDED